MKEIQSTYHRPSAADRSHPVRQGPGQDPLQRNTTGESIGEIRQLAREHHIPIQLVPPEKLDALTRANHQGVIAFAGLVQYLDLQQVIDHGGERRNVPLFVMLDGVTDVRNIGAIARTARLLRGAGPDHSR